MKKIALKWNIQNDEEMLTREQLKNVLGGNSDTTGCAIRCDQNEGDASEIDDCSTASAKAACGDDLSDTVCICI